MVSVKAIVGGLLLMIMGVEDFRYHSIHIVWLWVFAVLGMILCYLQEDRLMISLVCSLWIFIACCLAKKISRGGIGNGDIWILCSLPLWEWGPALWGIYGGSLIAAGFHGFVLYLYNIRKKRRTHEQCLAFVPWICAAYIIAAVY